MNVHIVDERTAPSSYLQEFAEPCGYLDFARFGPVSASVTAQKVLDAEQIHRDSTSALARLDLLTEKAQASAGRLLDANPHEVAFVSSTSHGVFSAAQALSHQNGTVLVPRDDFPSNIYPWIRAAERGGLKVRWLEGTVTADSVRAALDSSVKAVAVSAVDAGSGAKAPLAAIKELIGPDRVLAVDGVQALGATVIDADAADILSAGGQKWLRAGWGAAMLLVRDRVADLLQPGLGGWSGVVDPLSGSPHPHPSLRGAVAHTVTNPDATATAALGVAMDLVLDAGIATIGSMISDNLARLLDVASMAGAEIMDSRPAAGIGNFRVPGLDAVELHEHLARAGISATRRGGWIRISPHASSSNQSVDALAAALSSLPSHQPF